MKKEKKELFNSLTHGYLKNKKAITLIALVITIIVLIILAGVAINLTLGDSGIFNRAKYARSEYMNAKAEEEIEISQITNELSYNIDGTRENDGTWTFITSFDSCNNSIVKNIDLTQYKEVEVRAVLTTENWYWGRNSIRISDLDSGEKGVWISFLYDTNNFVSARVNLTKTTASWVQYNSSNSNINLIEIWAK